MVMIKDKEGIEVFSVTENLYKYANKIKHKLKTRDTWYLMLFGGDMGTGKSLAAMRFGYIVDKNIDNSRVCQTYAKFKKAVLSSKKGGVVIGDEAISLFF